jgi:hypothetical protein
MSVKKKVFYLVTYLVIMITIILQFSLLIAPRTFAGSVSPLTIDGLPYSSRSIWHGTEVKNLTAYYYFTDGRMNLVQDWMGQIKRNGVVNVTMPQSLSHWTFDYDQYSHISDSSITGKTDTYAIYHPNQPSFFTEGIVHYLGFEECTSEQCKDWSRNKQNASITFTTYLSRNYTDCKKGACIHYGNSPTVLLNISNKTYNSNLVNLSISAWIQFHGSSTEYPKIVYKANNFNGFMEVYLEDANATCGSTGARLAFWRYVIPGPGLQSAVKISDCYPLRDGSWHHVAITSSNGSGSYSGQHHLYIDGVETSYEYSQSSIGTPANDSKGYWIFGKDPLGTDADSWNGNIDEVYIFNRSLLPREIVELSKDQSHNGYAYLFRNTTTERLTVPNTVNSMVKNCTAISLWMYPFKIQGVGLQKIVQKGLYGNGAYGIVMTNTTKTGPYADIRFTLTNSAGMTLSANCFNCIQANRWYHVVATTTCNANGKMTNHSIYVNGVPGTAGALGPGSYTGSGWFSTTSALTFDELNNGFTGIIDDVILYNVSLSAQQVRYLYENSFYKPLPVLNGTWSANFTVTNFSGIPEQKLSSGINNSYVYDSAVLMTARDDLSISLINFTLNTTNANNSEKRRTTANGLTARLNLSYGRTNFMLNKTGYDAYTQRFTVYAPQHNLSMVISPYVNLSLWDEVANTIFDPANISFARLWFNDNASYYDFKLASRPWYSFRRNAFNTTRIELGYLSGTVVNRYIDPQTLDAGRTKVCANKEGVTHYVQYVTSTSNTLARMKNSYIGCYILSDYTRFGYQNAYLISAFTINTNYDLTTLINGVQGILASIDGSIESTISLDTLAFTKKGYNIDVSLPVLSIEYCTGHNCCTGTVCVNNSLNVYYYNVANDSTLTTLSIYNYDTNALLYSTSNFLNPNKWNIFYDHSAGGINASSIIKAIVCRTVSGVQHCRTEYTQQPPIGERIPPQLAALLSCLIFVFGMTLARPKISFGWFGIFIILIAMFVLSMSTWTWYVKWIITLEAIGLLFIISYLFANNDEAIA